jgi:MFS family permease
LDHENLARVHLRPIGTGLGYTAELFPTQIRGTGVGASFTFGLAAASLAPMIMGWIATAYSVAAGLPLLALSFLLLAPLFIWFAPDEYQLR